jgi:peptide/nickel transport system substrate-binding protein
VKRMGWLGILAVTVVAAAFAAGCGGGGEEAAAPPAEPAPPSGEPAAPGESAPPAEEPAGEPLKGGTYRVDVESSFNFTQGFDPTAEYAALAWSFYSLFLRPLMGYPRTAGDPGNEVIPDLAADYPEISQDGLTYTFTLKDGVMFSPPLNRAVTSKDVAYAMKRLANPKLNVGGYSGYYTDIVGWDEYGAGDADDIEGITTPDDKTIVFTLKKPVGDFLYRMAMPATAPIPEEVGKCFTEVGGYARDIIASGPYMIEGSDQIDATSCDSLKPSSGYDPDTQLIFVRNPNYDPATETPDGRQNNPDRFEFKINTNADDCFNRVRESIIEDTLCGETPKQIKEWTEDEDLKDNLKYNPDDSVFYLSMRLTEPPFDDVHVRRAMNFVMDRDGLRLAWGGDSIGELATHVAPPSLSSPELDDYDPYNVIATDGAGDVEAAMEEMKQSKYDTDKDGLCDAPECSGILEIEGTDARDDGTIPIIADSASKIGITFEVRQIPDAYGRWLDVTKRAAFSGTAGWGKDYPDAFTIYFYLFYGKTIQSTSTNDSLVGLTQKQADDIGIPLGIPSSDSVPSVDADIDNCVSIADNDERSSCWAELDKKLTEEVVPYVAWIWRNNTTIIADSVAQWDFDQATGEQSWTRVAVDPSLQNS